jgi:hypothetical protein
MAMTDEPLALLFTALDIVAFERTADGNFRPLTQPPAWFGRLSRDGTFPFLGHILEEAQAFWNARADGGREWGPSADVTEEGREFHYLVKALRVQGRAYLVFQRDSSAERMRAVLQKVRSDALGKQDRADP